MRFIPIFLRKINCFDYEHKVAYKQEETKKTAFGGCVSLIVGTCLGLIITFLGIDLISRNTPVVLKGESEQEEAKIRFRDLESFFVIVDREGNLLHLDPNFMKSLKIRPFMLKIEDTHTDIKVDHKEVQLVPCTEDFISDELVEASKAKLKREYVLCPEVPEDFYVVNEYSTIGSATFALNIELCDETANPGCREPLKQASGLQFIFSNIERYFDPYNYTNPIGARMLNTPTNMGIGMNAIRSTVIKVNEVLVDDAIVFESVERREFYSTDSTSVQSQLYSESENKVFELRIEATKAKNTYRRRYTKIQELIAFVGGIAKVIVFLGRTMGKSYAKCYFLRCSLVDLKCHSNIFKRETDNSLVKLTLEKRARSKMEVLEKVGWWRLMRGLVCPQVFRNSPVREIINMFDVFEMKMETERIRIQLEQIERQVYGSTKGAS